MRSFVVFAVFLLAAMAVSSRALASTAAFEIFDGGGNSIGQVDVIEEANDALTYYNPGGASANPPFITGNAGLHIAIHHDTTTGVYSLIMILDSIGGGGGGRFRGTLSGLGAGAFLAFVDDAGEATMTGPGTASFNFRWFNCCTDGLIISGIDPTNFSFILDTTLIQV